MVDWAERLRRLGTVVPFDYDYMAAGKKRPDRHPRLLERHRSVLYAARKHHQGPIVLAGKSMGGRIGCHLSVEEDVAAVVCFGFPLRTIAKVPKVRDEVLVSMRTPVLFCQGSKDRMGPLDLFAEVRGRMTAPSELFVVEGGAHGLELGKRFQASNGITQDASDANVLAAVASFLGNVL